MKLFKRIKEYYQAKQFDRKCGLEVKDICKHETDTNAYLSCPVKYKCSKCGEFYR